MPRSLSPRAFPTKLDLRRFLSTLFRSLGWASLFSLCACAVQLTDRTVSPTSYDGPLNIQIFAAETELPRSREVRDVALDMGGASEPMTSVGGNRWEAEVALPVCDEVVGYRFVVHYDDRGDTSPPFLRRVFPETGQFVRRITDQPIECAGRPTLGSRAFVVDTSEDLVDSVPGDGICSTTADPAAGGSRCSLRAAIMEANAQPGLNLIALDGGRYLLSRTGPEERDRPDATVGDLDITDSVVIQNDRTQAECPENLDAFLDPTSRPPYQDRSTFFRAGVVKIDANGIDRVLDIYPGSIESPTEVYLYCLHLLGGLREGGENLDPRGGGILNRGMLLLDRVAVTENRLSDSNSFGAGIYNAGRLVIRESALLHNEGGTRGAVFGGTTGGAIFNHGTGTVSIDRSVIAFNSAARGPAIWNDRHVDEDRDVISSGQVSLTNTTVTDHRAGEDAGALASAIVNRGTARISWSSLWENDKPVLHGARGRVYVGNSLLRGPTSESPCASGGRGISSMGGNWFSQPGCTATTSTADIVRYAFGTSGSLNDRGGFTPTRGLREPASDDDPAEYPIDQGGTGLPLCPAVDQRGFARPVDGNGDGVASCDVGAFEFGASAPTS